MKAVKHLLLFLVLLSMTEPQLYSADSDCDVCVVDCNGGESQFEQDLDEKDWEALYDYINTKRTINVQEKACNLTISGDVRAGFKRRCEEDQFGLVSKYDNIVYKKDENGEETDVIILEGDKLNRFQGKNRYEMDFNLRFDYVCGRAWAVAHLQFDNKGGVCNEHSCTTDPYGMHGSGTGCDIDLKKAYLGYNLCCDGCTRFDIEVGRRRLYQVFDSQVQFLSRFDGILLKYDSCCECLGDWYVHLGGLIVDSRSDHYSWVVEGGVDDVCNTGFDVKYSYIDWNKKGKNYCGNKDAYGNHYQVSQFTLYYHFTPEYICKPTEVYAAYLINTDYFKPSDNTSDTFLKEIVGPKANCAWYVGFTIGEVVYAGDWAFSTQYQWVEARSVPDDDVSGIGNGNARNYTFTGRGYGNTNFKGWRIEALYAFTDNISVDARAEWSTAIDTNHFGEEHKYSQVKVEAIYAF